MAEFYLFGKSFSIKDSYIRNHTMNLIGLEACDKAETEFFSWFDKCSGIDAVMDGYFDIATYLVEKYAINPLFERLKTLNIYDINLEMYKNKCLNYSKVVDAYDYIESDIEDIIEDQNMKKEYRAARKANRARMVGGGYGLSGAIKGAVQAGAINATTGMAHGVVNAIGNTGTAIMASAKKAALYNKDTKETLSTGIFHSILAVYNNHKELVNCYIRNYYEKGFEPLKATALFENAKKLPEKREELLFEAVKKHPDERILSYIFINYKSEQKNIYEIGQAFSIDFTPYIEASFAAAYTNEVKASAEKVAEVKEEILSEMREYGIKTSTTLTRLNYDELMRIANHYSVVDTDSENEEMFRQFHAYDAPVEQKRQVVKEQGIWEIAPKYSVVYSAEEIEKILNRYYSGSAREIEEDALAAKKQLKIIMDTLGIKEAATFDQLEKDCLARICINVAEADEETCNRMRNEVMEYDALEKNKAGFLEELQKRIEAIWSKEDGEIFDNLYMNKDIRNQEELVAAIEFVREKGRTSSSEKYIQALQACTEENIKKAKVFQKKSIKISNIVGIILVLAGIVGVFTILPLALIAVPGVVLMVRYSKLKKNWNILTIEGTQIHEMLILQEAEKYIESNEMDCLTIEDSSVIEEAQEEVRQGVETIVGKETSMKNSVKGIVAFILGIVSVCSLGCLFVPQICGIVFGIIAVKDKEHKRGLAWAGLIMSIIMTVFIAFVMFSE